MKWCEECYVRDCIWYCPECDRESEATWEETCVECRSFGVETDLKALCLSCLDKKL